MIFRTAEPPSRNGPINNAEVLIRLRIRRATFLRWCKVELGTQDEEKRFTTKYTKHTKTKSKNKRERRELDFSRVSHIAVWANRLSCRGTTGLLWTFRDMIPDLCIVRIGKAERSETCGQVSDLSFEFIGYSIPSGSRSAFWLITCSQDIFTDGRAGGSRLIVQF